MKNNLFYSRGIAWAITAAVIILSFLLGGGKSLGKLKTDATDIFYNGVSGDGLGIQRELEHRVDYAYNMVTIANRYISGDKAVTQLTDARDALINSNGIAQKSANNHKLTEAAAALYDRLGNEKLSEADARLRESVNADLKARNNIILNDGYNGKAREFNKALGVFPASVIKTLGIVTELPLF